MLVLIPLLIFLLFIVFTYFVVGSKFKEFKFSPLSVFIFFYGLVYCIVPIIQLFFSEYNRFDYFENYQSTYEDILFTTIILALYLLMVIVGFSFAKVKTSKNEQILKVFRLGETRFEKSLLIFLSIILGVAYILLVIYVLPIMIYDYQLFMVNRITLLAGMGYLTAPILLSVPISILLMLFIIRGQVNFKRGNRIIYIFVFGILIVSFFMNISLGSRLGALINIIYFGFTYVLFKKDRKNTKIGKYFGYAILIIYVVSILGNIRELAKRENISSINAERIFIDKEIFDEIVEEVSNSFSHFQFVVFLVKNNNWNYALGDTYLSGFLMPVPRAFWYDKPVGGGPYLKNIVKPNSYVLYEANNSSYTTGAPLEAYMNFGIIGVILIGIIHGILIGKLTNWGYKVKYLYQLLIYVILLFALGEMIVYGEFAGVLVRSGTMIIPILFYRKLYLIFKKQSTIVL